MPRNYKKEAEWQRKKYVRILGDIDPDVAEKLKAKLAEQNISIARWITKQAIRYLEEQD